MVLRLAPLSPYEVTAACELLVGQHLIFAEHSRAKLLTIVP